MFTQKRWVPPIYTGDQRRDFDNLTRSINEYLLSLEGKEALVTHQGKYTPTITGVANHGAATSAECMFVRVDSDVVIVSGVIEHDPTAAAPTLTRFRVSLPIVSDLTAATHLGGAGVRFSVVRTLAEPVGIYADTTNNEAEFLYMATNAGNYSLSFTFSYRVL